MLLAFHFVGSIVGTSPLQTKMEDNVWKSSKDYGDYGLKIYS